MSKIAIITGANQGLGFALAEGLAQRLEARDVVYLTGRDGTRVAAAGRRVRGARAEVRARVLDVRDTAAVNRFANEIEAIHGGVDIVFSNHYQRVLPSDSPAEVVANYVDTNNLGTTRMLRAFSPLLRRGGRLLVVASTLGTLHELPAELHSRFDTETMTLDGVDATMLAWRDAVIDGRAHAEGWPAFINIPSKVGQVAAVRVLARDRRAADLRDGTLVAAVCPGMIDTGASRPWFDMSNAQPPAQATIAPLRLALSSAVDPRFQGELVRFGEVLAWRPQSASAATPVAAGA
jgi:NAD(P)-dependent dehydrogenase (short-subunit alcohol dehydrogenase family)